MAYREGPGEKPNRGEDSKISGVKRGGVGLGRESSNIKNAVFSKNWNTPLNAEHPKGILPKPTETPIMSPDKLGMPGNPTGIGGFEMGKKGRK